MKIKIDLNKKGTFIISDIIFLVLALSFVTILLLFISKQSSNTILIEEQAAKQIALALDALPSKTQFTMYVGEILKEKDPNFSSEVIKIDNERNVVRVKLSEKSGYEYSFFNDLFFSAELKGDYLVITSNEIQNK